MKKSIKKYLKILLAVIILAIDQLFSDFDPLFQPPLCEVIDFRSLLNQGLEHVPFCIIVQTKLEGVSLTTIDLGSQLALEIVL